MTLRCESTSKDNTGKNFDPQLPIKLPLFIDFTKLRALGIKS